MPLSLHKNSPYLLLPFRNEQGLYRTIHKEAQVLSISEHRVKKEGQRVHKILLDTFLQYLLGGNYSVKVAKAAEKAESKVEELSALETELENIPETLSNEEALSGPILRYSLNQEQFMQELRYGPRSAHEQLYGHLNSLPPEEDKYEPAAANETDYDPSIHVDEEAIEELEGSRYEFLDTSVDLNYEKQQKLALWIKFNPGLFSFLEYFHGLSRDTNYNLAA